MPRFMKTLNNISRSQATFRSQRVSAEGLCSSHHAFVLTICKNPGHSQEEIASELCLNKSTVTRALSHLEEQGYITREQASDDKRQLAVFPTPKMLDSLEEIRAASREWNSLISDGIPQEELEIFYSVLSRMEERAKGVIRNGEQN